MVKKSLKELAEVGFEEISEDVLLNRDYYAHKVIMEIIQAPKQGMEFLVIYVDMLEKILKAGGVISEEDVKEINEKVEEYIKSIERQSKGLDTKVKMIMRFNKKFELLMEKLFAMRPEEGAISI